MFVHAFLLYRKGLGGFDPVSDGWLIWNNEPEQATYCTWRTDRDLIPQGSRIAGVFLGDYNGNFVYEGTRNNPGPGYVKYVFPKLEEGYKHSEFHRMFTPPEHVQSFLHQIARMNYLYFGPSIDEPFILPDYEESAGFSFVGDDEKGVRELRCPNDLRGESLKSAFYEMARWFHPHGRHCDPRLKNAA
jgi:hypothetical protein